MKIKDCIIQESKPDQAGQQDRTNPCLGQGCVFLAAAMGWNLWKELSAGRNLHVELMTLFREVLAPCPHGDGRRRSRSASQSDPGLQKI